MAAGSLGQRLLGYIRVSDKKGREGASYISPEVQRATILALAKANGFRVAEFVNEEDFSGSRASAKQGNKRPGWDHCVERCQAHEADGIIVARQDRFSRSILDTAMVCKTLRDAGAILVSTDGGLGGEDADLQRNIMAVFAEHELARITSNWNHALDAHVARGCYHGLAPFGYRKVTKAEAIAMGDDGKAGTLVPTEDAATVVQVFEMRAAGRSWSEIVLATGNLKTHGSWAAIIRNRAYLGEVNVGARKVVGAHAPLVSLDLWEAAQVKVARAPRKGGSLLRGLVRCAGCGYTLTYLAGGTRSNASPSYRCRRRHGGGVICGAPAQVSARRLEAHVLEEFWGHVADTVAAEGSESNAEARETAAKLEAAEARYSSYLNDREAVLTLTPEERNATLRLLREIRDEAQVEAAAARRTTRATGILTHPRLRVDFEEAMDMEARRDVLGAGIETITVSRAVNHLSGSRCAPLAGRVVFDWVGGAPEEARAMAA